MTLMLIARHAVMNTTTQPNTEELLDELVVYLEDADMHELVRALRKARHYGVSLEEIEAMEAHFATA